MEQYVGFYLYSLRKKIILSSYSLLSAFSLEKFHFPAGHIECSVASWLHTNNKKALFFFECVGG